LNKYNIIVALSFEFVRIREEVGVTYVSFNVDIYISYRRDINQFKKGYQPRTKLVKDENGDLLADSHSTLIKWKNFFSQLLNVHGVNGVRQTEIQAAEPLVPEPSSLEVETAIEKLKSYKSQSINQILAELIQAGGNTLCSEILKLVNCILNREELPEQWKEPIILPVYKKGNKTDSSNYQGMSLLSAIYKILSNIILSRLMQYVDEIIGDHQCGF
jgi:hypothetical protein